MNPNFNEREVGAIVAPCPAAAAPTHWIELELVGEDGTAIPGVEYYAELPNGAIARGFLDDNGFARIEGVPAPGSARIHFPDLDGDAWQFIETAGPRSSGSKARSAAG